MKLETALQKIYSMHQFNIKLGLENIEKLLKFIGNPEKKLKAFHIAGSNGKGSTASFIASILQEAGFNVGLYTSPHFVKFNERIRINCEMIPDEYIAEFINEINDYIDDEEPTFFEITTALAFKYFAENNLDYVVIEVGLGGRLDATNTLKPIASVITSISLEHTNILGESIKQIASEKAGILKKNGVLFLGQMKYPIAESVILDKANQLKNKIHIFENQIELKEFAKVKFTNEKLLIYSTPLKGKYQIHNAALASVVVRETFKNIKLETILAGINNVRENSGIQGRYEIFSESPLVIFDSAHNDEGIDLFIKEFLDDELVTGKKILIFGGMKDKNLGNMLKQLSFVFDDIFVASINYERAATLSDFQEIAGKLNLTIIPLKDPTHYIEKFLKESEDQTLVVLGSIYLLGEIKTRFQNK